MMEKAQDMFRFIALLTLILTASAGVFWFIRYLGLVPPRYFSAQEFNIETVRSNIDFNRNGIDDYTDFVLGARQDALNRPRYDSSWQEKGYPPPDIGVCTDVVWRAFRHAGYNLKEMIDRDIAANTELYPYVESQPDPSIDFRRVPNLLVFFERYAQSLTTDITEIDQWQPGDIVIYGVSHIGIVSDRRNEKGVPWLIHNSGQPRREEDGLDRGYISGHYRFDADRIPSEELVAWLEPTVAGAD